MRLQQEAEVVGFLHVTSGMCRGRGLAAHPLGQALEGAREQATVTVARCPQSWPHRPLGY